MPAITVTLYIIIVILLIRAIFLFQLSIFEILNLYLDRVFHILKSLLPHWQFCSLLLKLQGCLLHATSLLFKLTRLLLAAAAASANFSFLRRRIQPTLQHSFHALCANFFYCFLVQNIWSGINLVHSIVAALMRLLGGGGADGGGCFLKDVNGVVAGCRGLVRRVAVTPFQLRLVRYFEFRLARTKESPLPCRAILELWIEEGLLLKKIKVMIEEGHRNIGWFC